MSTKWPNWKGGGKCFDEWNLSNNHIYFPQTYFPQSATDRHLFVIKQKRVMVAADFSEWEEADYGEENEENCDVLYYSRGIRRKMLSKFAKFHKKVCFLYGNHRRIY